jgi:hypothetical protein
MTTLTLPCRRDPAAWDITGGSKPPRGTKPWHVEAALRAVAGCGTCPIMMTCAARAAANPPAHRCVQGGIVFELVGGYRTVPIAPKKWAARYARTEPVAPKPEVAPVAAEPCAHCEGPIADPRPGKKFCSRLCRRRYQDRQSLARKSVRACPTCGQDRGDTTQAKKVHALRHVMERREEARRNGTYTDSHWSKTTERVQATAQMAAAGTTPHEVAARFDVDYQTAKRYLDRARKEVLAA